MEVVKKVNKIQHMNTLYALLYYFSVIQVYEAPAPLLFEVSHFTKISLTRAKHLSLSAQLKK